MNEPQLWVSAFDIGSFYGLLALCYLIGYQGARLFNFAIGAYAMLAGLGAAWIASVHGVNPWVAAAFGLLLGAAASVITELVVVRPLFKRTMHDELPLLIAVAATMFTIEQGAGGLIGRINMPGKRLIDFAPLRLGDAAISSVTIQMLVLTVLVFGGMAIWLRTTTTGRVLRAVGDNLTAASVLGLPMGRIRLVAFVLTGVIAGLAGVIFASKSGISFRSGLPWALQGFLAVVIGGTGTVWAPLAGGMILGCMEVFVPYYFGGAARDYGILALALVFFAFRPEGIFAHRVRA